MGHHGRISDVGHPRILTPGNRRKSIIIISNPGTYVTMDGKVEFRDIFKHKGLMIVVGVSALMLLSASAVIVSSYSEADGVQTGDAGGGVQWKWDPSVKTLSFLKVSAGDGRMNNYGPEQSIVYPPWEDYDLLVENIVIGEGVKYLGTFSFDGTARPYISATKMTVPCDMEYGRVSIELLTNLKEIKITGSGPMKDYSSERKDKFECKAPWHASQEKLEKIIFDYGVTSIPVKSFSKYYKHLTTVEFPSTITKIGDYAFYGCVALKDFALPRNLESIGEYAFSYCDVRSLTIPDSVTSIGDYAFSVNEDMTEATLSRSMDGIPDGIFESCYKLKKVNAPAVKTIGEEAFSNCYALQRFEFKEGLTSIGKNAFYYAGLITADLPSTLKQISTGAFGCSKLESVHISSADVKVESAAFFGDVQLKEVAIADGSSVLCKDSFLFSTYIEKLIIGEGVTVEPDAFKMYSFYKDGGRLDWNQLAGHTFEGSGNLVLTAVD